MCKWIACNSPWVMKIIVYTRYRAFLCIIDNPFGMKHKTHTKSLPAWLFNNALWLMALAAILFTCYEQFKRP